MAKRSRVRTTVRVGVISRIDFMSAGYRRGLLEAAFEKFRLADVRFIVIAGGLISNRDFARYRRTVEEQAKAELRASAAIEREKPKDERQPVESSKDLRERIRDATLQCAAEKLAEAIPQMQDASGKPVKIYIVTAPALNYDGAPGTDIAERLSMLRPEIFYWGREDSRFPLQNLRRADGSEKDFWLVQPVKAAWRSKYYSNRPDRLVEDKEMQPSQGLPDLWLSDCGAVFMMRPQGQLSRMRVSPPGLHRLQEVTTSENQVGVCVLEFSDRDAVPVWMNAFKDFLARERSLIPAPEGATALQLAIFRQIADHPSTIGMLESALHRSRKTIEAALADYARVSRQPPIVFDEASKKYDFARAWMQETMRYPVVDRAALTVDRMVAFGCLHAGYLSTQYRWWVNRLPELILENGATILVGCGDYIAGLKHNLHLRGEVFAGFNYTQQEKLAARLVGSVMFKVFDARLTKALSSRQRRPSEAVLTAAVEAALLEFLFFEGNHDKWLTDAGVDPLATFEPHLVEYLTEKIESYLREKGLALCDVAGIVRRHVVFANEHRLPSGLVLGINHPEMGRAQTSSLRTQHTMKARPNCHIVALANFHETIMIQEYNAELGQRVGLQVGTVTSGTEFEDGKLKVVDTGVAFLDAYSSDGRILVTRTVFEGPRPDEIENRERDEIFRDFLGKIGV